jgi:hypothetical protein
LDSSLLHNTSINKFMSNSIFSTLEQNCALERELEELREKISLLEQENSILKQRELDRTKLNMDGECACIYTNNTSTYIYGEKEQLDRLLENCTELKFSRSKGVWGDTISFISIASARTCLLRSGYKYSYTSQTFQSNSSCLYVENWIRGV